MAIITGKNLIKDEKKINQLFVYKKTGDVWDLHKRIKLKDKKEFAFVCPVFHFVVTPTEERTKLIFARID
jgi:hypothetical protein